MQGSKQIRLKATLCLAACMVFLGALTGCEVAEDEGTVGEDGRVYYSGWSPDDGYQHVGAEEAAQIIEWGDCTLVDVRGSVQYDNEHIPGAIDFCYDDTFLANAPTRLPNKHETIVVYCDYGGISKMAAQDLAEAGYTNVVEFNGMEVWNGATESGPEDTNASADEKQAIPWDKWASGLLVGLLFGYVVKRSRFCMTGLIRDIYLEKRPYNLALLFGMISIVGLLYFGMGHAGLIRLPLYLPPFSLFSIAVGSLLFGIGAVMANGCLISTLVKCGDGRLMGLISLGIFIICGYFASAGPGSELTGAARSIAIVDDAFIGRLDLVPLIVFGIMAIVCISLMVHTHLTRKPTLEIPARYTGLRHLLFEKGWTREFTALAIALVLALAFPVSEAVGRHYGFAVATPVLSWAYTLLDPPVVVGGCNPFDLRLGWASFLVLGVILGSLLSSIAAEEFSLVKPSKKVLVRSIIGSILMGFGAVLGQGCMISNGLVGTAQFSAKSWYALLFLALGVFIASRVFLKKRLLTE